MLSNLLIYRWLILNTFVAIGFAITYYYGWLTLFVEQDKSHISAAILVVFFITWIYQGLKARTISGRINAFKHAAKNDLLDEYKDSILPIEKLIIIRDKDLMKLSWMRHIGGSLILLGFIGTVLGFIIALSGVPESGLSGQEGVEGIQDSVSLIIAGMHIALYTTLAGAITGGLIIYMNTALIYTALYNHWADVIVKLGK